MKYSDIKTQSKPELTNKLKSAKEDLFQARMKNSLGQLSNPVQIRFMRKNIAKLMTALKSQSGGGR